MLVQCEFDQVYIEKLTRNVLSCSSRVPNSEVGIEEWACARPRTRLDWNCWYVTHSHGYVLSFDHFPVHVPEITGVSIGFIWW